MRMEIDAGVSDDAVDNNTPETSCPVLLFLLKKAEIHFSMLFVVVKRTEREQFLISGWGRLGFLF